MNLAYLDPPTPPRAAVLDDALRGELETLRAQRAALIAHVRGERADGATVVRCSRVLTLLGAR